MVIERFVTQLRELALALPRPGCEWEERPRFDPPASPESLAVFERAAGFPMPADLRAFFAQTAAIAGMSVHNGYWLGGIEQLVRSIECGDFPRAAENELTAPIATDGGGNGFLLSVSGRVWRWDHETGQISQLAATFNEFLARVVADWEAYIGDTAGWRFLT